MTLKITNKSSLLKYKTSVKHKKCFETAKATVDLIKFMKNKSTASRIHQTAIIGDLLLAAYFAEHNIAFACVGYFPQVGKAVLQESTIAEKYKIYIFNSRWRSF